MRLDQALVARGLCASRARASALIRQGAARINGAVAARPAQKVGEDDRISLIQTQPDWASRGALKLLRALDGFSLSPRGATALDLGASTGGFTDVLLARGAARVIALDVGRGQLVARLRDDPRVLAIEGVNARDLATLDLPDFNWLTADLSFISLEKALPPALARIQPGGTLVALVKPQFEVGRARIGKGGVVRDAQAQAGAVRGAEAFLSGLGWRVIGAVESPISGGDGNREWLVAATAPAFTDGHA